MRIAIVEDQLMMRDVIRKSCHEASGHEVVAEAETGRAAVAAILRTSPDLVLLDIQLPDMDGFSVLNAIRAADKNCRAIILSSFCDDYTVYLVERARVQGFIDKNSSAVSVLQQALTQVALGGVYFSEAYRKAKAARRSDPHAFDKLLTDREQTILSLIGSLLTDYEISLRLGISDQTVEKHRFNILRKLDLHSTPELARYARDHGFTTVADQTTPRPKRR